MDNDFLLMQLEQLLVKYTPEPYRQALISMLTLERKADANQAETIDYALAAEALEKLKAAIRDQEGLNPDDGATGEEGPF
jgi:hypothetical protein